MLRILVADDEKVTRKGVITLLERGLKEEIEYIEAANGVEAMEVINNQMVHLIITDICMPLLSGLDFVAKLRECDSEMEVIIISAYENFEYAKQAVQLGVKDYITKPLHKDELLEVVENCIADIRKKQLEMQQSNVEVYKQSLIIKEVKYEVLRQVMLGIDVQTGIHRLQHLGVEFEGNFFFVTKFTYEWNREFSDILDFAIKNILDECLDKELAGQYLSFIYSPKQIVILFWIDEIGQKTLIEKKMAEIVRLVEKIGRVKAVAGIGSLVYKIEKVKESFEGSCIATDCKIFNTTEKVIRYEAIPKGNVKSSLHRKREFYSINVNEIEKRIIELLKFDVSIETIMDLHEEYESFLNSCFAEISREEYGEVLDFSEYWSIFELRHELKSIKQFWLNSLEEQGDKLGKTQLVSDVLEFALQHVTEDIDLNYIAEIFGKTPGYIGTIFKRERNQGFNEFITGERIKMAKQFLKDASLSVQEVGKRCGYHNSKYFSIVFKKAEGVSPKTYQMMLKKGE